jgi:hypothetical protein
VLNLPLTERIASASEARRKAQTEALDSPLGGGGLFSLADLFADKDPAPAFGFMQHKY